MAVPVEDIDIQHEIDESVGANIAGDESWRITDDSTADWALRRIAWHTAQIVRRREVVQREIERLQAYLQSETERHERSIRFFEAHLRAYFERLRAEAQREKVQAIARRRKALQGQEAGMEWRSSAHITRYSA